MDKRVLWSAAARASVGLALCSALGVMAQRDSRALPTPPIAVQVVDGRAVVAVTSVRTGGGQATLSWNLLTPGYRFNSDSINFRSAAGYFSCSTYNYGQGIRCTKSADAPSGSFRYSVSVSSGGSNVVQESEPNIWINNE